MSSYQNAQKFDFYQYDNYGTRLLKGVSRDQIINELAKYPLLIKYYKKNQFQIQNRIIDTLMREPSNADCPGFIYGFKDYTEHKSNPYAEKYEIKMGRTKRQVPQDRIYQWENQDGHQYVELFTIRSQHNNKLQSLVHLFFAYARRIKIINGKRRIQWFNFQEKSLNAAVTALINQLMEKVHMIGKANQSLVLAPPFDLALFCVQIQEVLEVQFLKKRLVLIGPKKSGKSVVKGVLNGDKLKSVAIKNCQNILLQNLTQFTIQLPKQIDFVQTILQLNKNSEQIVYKKSAKVSPQAVQKLKLSFYQWTVINSVEQMLIPCLVVTQNDILSSQMVSFRNALRNLMRYVKISQIFNGSTQKDKCQKFGKSIQCFKLFLIVSKAEKSYGFSEQKLKKFFVAQKQLLQQQQLQILVNSTIHINELASKQGTYQSDTSQFTQKFKNLSSSDLKSISYEYTDPSISILCEQITHFLYEQVGVKFQDYFKSCMRNIVKQFDSKLVKDRQQQINDLALQSSQTQQGLNSLMLADSKLKFIDKLQILVNEIKSTRKQNQVLINLKKLQILLGLSQSDKILSQLEIFCQCTVKACYKQSIGQYQESEDNNEHNALLQKLLSPCYLENTLIFSKLTERIEIVKGQIRDQVNYVIDNQIKNTLSKVVCNFYSSIDDKNPQKRALFNETYNILFKMMNIHEVIQSERVEKKIPLQKVSNEFLQEQILIKLISQFLQLSGGNGSVYLKELCLLIKMITLIYTISKQHKVKSNSLMSRIREAIHLGTKNKRTVEMINVPVQGNHIEEKDKNYVGYNNNGRNKKPYNNRAQVVNNQVQQNNRVVGNGGTKMIINKKDQAKNQRLINYINSKKKVQQPLPQQFGQVSNPRTQINHVQQSQSSNSSTNHRNTRQSSHSLVADHSKDLKKEEFFDMSSREVINVDEDQYPKLDQQEDSDEYFSLPEDQFSDEDYKKDNETYDQKQLDFRPLKNQQSKQIPNLSRYDDTDNQNQVFKPYTYHLTNSLSTILNTKTNYSTMKDLHDNLLYPLQVQQSYNQVIFNYTDASFQLNKPALTLHHSFIIIFAKKFSIQAKVPSNSSQINFKIHYKNRKPNRVHLIMMAESFQGVQKLKIQDNKFGKVLMVQLKNRSDKRYTVLDGYYTKNKRNEKKLQEFRVKQLVQVFCKLVP